MKRILQQLMILLPTWEMWMAPVTSEFSTGNEMSLHRWWRQGGGFPHMVARLVGYPHVEIPHQLTSSHTDSLTVLVSSGTRNPYTSYSLFYWIFTDEFGDSNVK
jgi:hypothetical protein